MKSLSAEIRDAIDNYRCANEMQRMLMARDVMQQLFIAERVWKHIKTIDEMEERIELSMEE